MVAAFAAGDCQMILTSVGDHGTIGRTAKPGMNWDVAMLPVYDGTKRNNSLVGGASLWVLAGKSPEEYKAAAAFLNFIAQPEQALFWSTNTGYIPVTKTGYDFMVKNGFYDKPPYKGREIAIASLTASDPTAVTRGIRLGDFTADPHRGRQRPAGDLRQQGLGAGRRSTARSSAATRSSAASSRPIRASAALRTAASVGHAPPPFGDLRSPAFSGRRTLRCGVCRLSRLPHRPSAGRRLPRVRAQRATGVRRTRWKSAPSSATGGSASRSSCRSCC